MTTAAIATGRTTRTTGTLATTGVAAATVASVATTVAVATGHAVGISLDMGGEPIPVFGFGMLTAVFSLVGLAIAAVLRRRAGQPRRTFIRTTLVLTTLSLVPDALADSAASTRALLMLTHLIAAAIVIPAIARRLPA